MRECESASEVHKQQTGKEESWLKLLFRYTDGSERRIGCPVILSIISVIGGLCPRIIANIIGDARPVYPT